MKGKYLRGLTFVLAFFMAFFFLAGSPGKVQAGLASFSDLEADSWYEDYVRFLAKRDIVKGYGSSGLFDPNRPVSRQEAAKMIALAASLDLNEALPTFPDLDPSSEMTPYIAALAAKGAVRGFPDGSFRPQDSLKRGHAAKILVLAFGLKAGRMVTVIQDFPLDPELREAIQILASNGLVKGYGQTGLFRPDQVLTRVDLSKILALSMVTKAIQEAERNPNRAGMDKLRGLLEDLSNADDQACLTYLEERSQEVQRRVEEDESPRVVLTGMSLYKEPDKWIYEIDEALDLSGLVVRLSYSDGSSRHVSAQQLASYGITSDLPDGSILKKASHEPLIIALTHRASGKKVTLEIQVLPPLSDRVDYLLAALNIDGETNAAEVDDDEGRVALLQDSSISGDLMIPHGVTLDDKEHQLTIPEESSLAVRKGGILRLRYSYGVKVNGQLIVHGKLICSSASINGGSDYITFYEGSQLIFTDDDESELRTLIGGPGDDITINRGKVQLRDIPLPSFADHYDFIIPQASEMTIRGKIDIAKPSDNDVSNACYQVAGQLLIDNSMLYGGTIQVEMGGHVHLSKDVEVKMYPDGRAPGTITAGKGAVTGEVGSKINFEATNEYSSLNGQMPDKATYHWQGGAWIK